MVDSYTFAQYFNRANTNDGGGLVFDEAALERIKTIRQGNTPTRTLLNTMERRPVMTENGKTIQVPSPTQTGLKSSIKLGTLNRAQSEYQRRYRQTHLYDQWQFS